MNWWPFLWLHGGLSWLAASLYFCSKMAVFLVFWGSAVKKSQSVWLLYEA